MARETWVRLAPSIVCLFLLLFSRPISYRFENTAPLGSGTCADAKAANTVGTSISLTATKITIASSFYREAA